MTDDNHRHDLLRGEPLTPEQEAGYAAWAEAAERGDFRPAPDGAVYEGDEAARVARAELDALLGATQLDEATRLGGRPSLDGTTGTGASPKRQVRLPRDLDAALTRRAAAEGVERSVIMRRAIETYLQDDQAGPTRRSA